VLALTDSQLEIVMTALRPLRSERERRAFLRPLEEQLRTRDIDVQSACERATGAVNGHVDAT
jgi:hypothetical protein